MNCPNCGAALPDGAMFCGSCGTSVQGGGQPQMQPQMQQFQQQPQMQPQMQQFQQQPQFQQQGMMGGYPGGMYMQAPPSAAGMAFADMWRLFGEGITRPLSAARSVVERRRGVSGLLLGIFYIIVVFFLLLIHLPFGKVEVPVGDRAMQGLYTIIIICGIYFLTALAGYIFRDKMNPNYSYLNILGMLGSLTVYPLFFAVLEMIFGLFNMGIAFDIQNITMVVWACMATVVLKEVIGGSEDGKMVKAVFSQAVIIIALALFALLIQSSLKGEPFGMVFIDNLFSSLSSFF